jgi:hypothetical protein
MRPAPTLAIDLGDCSDARRNKAGLETLETRSPAPRFGGVIILRPLRSEHMSATVVHLRKLARQPRPKKETKRQRQSRALERWWKKKIVRRYGEGFNGFSPIGEPICTSRGKPRMLRGRDLVRTLETLRDATRDPRVTAALEMIHERGFDKALMRGVMRAQMNTFGAELEPYFAQIRYLTTKGLAQHWSRWASADGENSPGDPFELGHRRRLSVRQACELLTAAAVLPGPSFAVTVERLRRAFMRANLG